MVGRSRVALAFFLQLPAIQEPKFLYKISYVKEQVERLSQPLVPRVLYVYGRGNQYSNSSNERRRIVYVTGMFERQSNPINCQAA